MTPSYDAATGTFSRGGRTIGKPAKNGYVYIRFDGHSRLAHRVAWFLSHGRWPTADLDHINGDRSDNRLCNLREATRSQNLANRKPCNKTGFKGVLVHPNAHRVKRYGAQCVKDGIYHFRGWFHTAEEASEAYKALSTELHGEFARYTDLRIALAGAPT